MSLPSVILKKGRDIPLKCGHPWVFSGGVAKDADSECRGLKAGSLVQVLDADGAYLGMGTWHRGNSIRVRIISRDVLEKLDENFFVGKFRKLLKEKMALLPPDTTGFRLVHSDADGFPGVVIDIFGSIAVYQISAAGFEPYADVMVSALQKVMPLKTVIEKNDDPTVKTGDAIDRAVFFENGLKMVSLCMSGQKTGFFLDQRDARAYLRSISDGRKVLDLFSNAGGFTLSAAAGGAESAVAVDVSEKALEVVYEMLKMNRLSGLEKNVQTVCKDVFEYLEKVQPGDFDIIVCDPPAFAKSRDTVTQALKAYVRLNRKCFEKLDRGGILITSSCSGAVNMDDFQTVVRLAAGQSGRDVRILKTLTQPVDHTLKMSFPEGLYLKTFVVQVL
ncbi:MAG: class I SAM-dependent rRNA methyltransferase [Spirochaetia bacterium]|nr:class I SAM-dependent rRNA methyltransferase [Spirochaetia bacterium]